jgi:hypothetical protein
MGNEAMTDEQKPQSLQRIPEPMQEERLFLLKQREAKAHAASSMVPKAYQDNIPNVLIAMDVAGRIGASVFAVMQNLDIIHGNPSWRATFLIGTVNACGRFTPIRFRFEGKEGTASWGCRAVATDRESGELCEGTLVTIKMANDEGWSSKPGSKWKTMPEQMLRYRAAAFWTRVYAPELSLGMRTSDEAEDIGPQADIVVRQGDAMQLSSLASKLAAPRPEPSRAEPTHDPETGEVLESEREPGDDRGEDE